MLKKIIGATVAIAVGLSAQTVHAADFSANIGFASEYIYRGIPQSSSSASAGLDLSGGGFNVGVWGADVTDGIEIDYYGGYSLEAGDFNLSVGGTLYTYTDDFDDTYLEANFGVGWKFLSFAAAVGEYDNFGGPTLDYQFYSLTATYEGFYGKVGTFADDFTGTYYEGGYNGTLTVKDTNLFDYAAVVVYSDADLLGGDSETNLTLTVTKSFSL